MVNSVLFIHALPSLVMTMCISCLFCLFEIYHVLEHVYDFNISHCDNPIKSRWRSKSKHLAYECRPVPQSSETTTLTEELRHIKLDHVKQRCQFRDVCNNYLVIKVLVIMKVVSLEPWGGIFQHPTSPPIEVGTDVMHPQNLTFFQDFGRPINGQKFIKELQSQKYIIVTFHESDMPCLVLIDTPS